MKGGPRREPSRIQTQTCKLVKVIKDATYNGIGTADHTRYEAFDSYAKEVSSTKLGELWGRLPLFQRSGRPIPDESVNKTGLNR